MSRIIAVVLLYFLFVVASRHYALNCTQQPLANVLGDSKVEGTSTECTIIEEKKNDH